MLDVVVVEGATKPLSHAATKGMPPPEAPFWGEATTRRLAPEFKYCMDKTSWVGNRGPGFGSRVLVEFVIGHPQRRSFRLYTLNIMRGARILMGKTDQEPLN